MKIIIKETSIVRPAQDTPKKRLWLSNLDLLQQRHHVPLVYLYKPNGSSCNNNFFEARVLKDALSKVLVPFYPVAGRLGRNENGRIELNCNGEGALFIQAETDSTMDELGDYLPDDKLRQLVPSVDYSKDISSYPILLIQVTAFSCGGVCLLVGWHHTVADGYNGATLFINSWASVSRGLSISPSLFLDRTLLHARSPPNPTFRHREYEQLPNLNTSMQDQKLQAGSKAECIAKLKITLDQLHSLKSKVKNSAGNTKHGTYEILAAHIWRCACKARGLPVDQASALYISVNGQSRFHPPLPPGYFGNVVFHTTAIALSGDLVSEPFLHTVERIQRAIQRMDGDYLRSAIDYLEELGDITQAVPKNYSCPNVKLVSWTRLPMYDADFGWGQPIYFQGGYQSEGKGHIQPSPTNDGSLYLDICLETDHMQAFQNLFYDFQFLEGEPPITLKRVSNCRL